VPSNELLYLTFSRIRNFQHLSLSLHTPFSHLPLTQPLAFGPLSQQAPLLSSSFSHAYSRIYHLGNPGQAFHPKKLPSKAPNSEHWLRATDTLIYKAHSSLASQRGSCQPHECYRNTRRHYPQVWLAACELSISRNQDVDGALQPIPAYNPNSRLTAKKFCILLSSQLSSSRNPLASIPC